MNSGEVHSIANGQQVIYLLDAAKNFEEKLLREWIQKERSPDETNAQPFTVPILHSENAHRLSHALSAPDDTLIAPVRIVWQPGSTVNETPRVRDLLLGGRHRPWKIRARRNAIALELQDLPARPHRITALAVTARGSKLQVTEGQATPTAQASNQ